MNVLKRFQTYMGSRRILLPFSLLFSGLSAVFGLAPFILIWAIVRELLMAGGAPASSQITVYAWWASGLAIASVVLYFGALMCSHLMAFRVESNLRHEAMGRLMDKPLGFFDVHTSGSIRKIIDDNASITHSFLAHQLPDLAGTLLVPLATAGLIFWFNWQLGLVCVAPFVVALLLMGYMMGTSGREFMKQYMTHLEEMNTEAVEYVRGIPVVKVFQQTIYSFKNFYRSIMDYNRMASRIKTLVKIVYKNKIHEQEMTVARQKAELLALRSQINPHFLFNALESIRMHSVIKKEKTTAEMVEKLAVMQRQYVDWGEDIIEVGQEMDIVRNYMDLQQYRFGTRLSYEMDVEDECQHQKIPKLTIVTFAENACVHGIEKKTVPGWVFIRVYRENEKMCIEVEDTGEGMTENEINSMRQKMENASIELLENEKGVGVINACLRLKMMSHDRVHFELSGEEGTGVTVLIRLPFIES